MSNPVELAISIIDLSTMLGKALTDAIKAGDVKATEELVKVLPSGAQIRARSAALEMQQLNKAQAELRKAQDTITTPPNGLPKVEG